MVPEKGLGSIQKCKSMEEEEMRWEVRSDNLGNPWTGEEIEKVSAAQIEEVRRIAGKKLLEDLASKSLD